MTHSSVRRIKLVLIAGIIALTVGTSACNRKKIDPGVMKTQFGIEIFRLVKQLNGKSKLDPAWDLANTVPELVDYMAQTTDVQYAVENQQLDPFSGSGSILLVSQTVRRSKSGAPIYQTSARFHTEWSHDSGKWMLERGKKLK